MTASLMRSTIAALLALAATGAAAPAHAAAPHLGAASGHAFVDKCSRGELKAIEGTSLSNGSLNTGFCVSSGKIVQVNQTYTKDGGGATDIQFFWEWTNSNGGTSVKRLLMATKKGINKGDTTTDSAVYPPGIPKPDGSNHCVRGGLLAGGQAFTTRVYCL